MLLYTAALKPSTTIGTLSEFSFAAIVPMYYLEAKWFHPQRGEVPISNKR